VTAKLCRGPHAARQETSGTALMPACPAADERRWISLRNPAAGSHRRPAGRPTFHLQDRNTAVINTAAIQSSPSLLSSSLARYHCSLLLFLTLHYRSAYPAPYFTG